jgi:sugar/nucleoside kinase (ribokinase family)
MSTEAKSRICIIGDINVDVITLLSGPLQKNTDTTSVNAITLGGSTCNVAVWLTHLDVEVNLVSAIGDDVLGTWVITQLQAFGVSDQKIRTISNSRTGTCVILVDETGARSMMPDFGANLVQSVDAELENLIKESDIVIMSLPTMFWNASPTQMPEWLLMRRLVHQLKKPVQKRYESIWPAPT